MTKRLPRRGKVLFFHKHERDLVNRAARMCGETSQDWARRVLDKVLLVI